MPVNRRIYLRVLYTEDCWGPRERRTCQHAHWTRPAGGGVRMCGFVVACRRYDPQVMRHVSGWAWHYLRRTALADFTCAIRCFARELEKTGTGPCVSPSLLYMSGPRTTIRPTAELTLLHVDHPQPSRYWFGGRARISRYPSAEPSVSRVRRSTTACLRAHNCALPGARSQDRDRGARPAHRI
jgi:hypothetical protein